MLELEIEDMVVASRWARVRVLEGWRAASAWGGREERGRRTAGRERRVGGRRRPAGGRGRAGGALGLEGGDGRPVGGGGALGLGLGPIGV